MISSFLRVNRSLIARRRWLRWIAELPRDHDISSKRKSRARKRFAKRWIHHKDRQNVRHALHKGKEINSIEPMGLWIHYI